LAFGNAITLLQLDLVAEVAFMDELIQAMHIVKVGRHQISFSPFSSGVFIRENWFHGIERSSSFKRVDVCYRRKKEEHGRR